MIVVTHEMGFARQAGDRLLFMDQGRIVEQGDPATVLDSPSTSDEAVPPQVLHAH